VGTDAAVECIRRSRDKSDVGNYNTGLGMTETSPSRRSNRLLRRHKGLFYRSANRLRVARAASVYGIESRPGKMKAGNLLPEDGNDAGRLQVRVLGGFTATINKKTRRWTAAMGGSTLAIVATIDADGFMVIRGRVPKDIIKSRRAAKGSHPG